MSLLLRPDTYAAETADGMYLLTYDGDSVIVGRTVYRLFERLAPLLDGRHTLAQLTTALDPQRRMMVEKLVAFLVERSAVRTVAADEPDITADVPGHRAEIGYVGQFRDTPRRRFDGYRNITALVIGTGQLAQAVAAAAARSGIACVVRAPDLATATPHTAGLVMHVADRPDGPEVDAIEARCTAASVPLAQVLRLDGQAWLVGIGTRWSHCRRRLASLRADPESRPSKAPVAGVAAAVVAAQLVHGVFQSLTGIVEPVPNRLVRVDLSTLGSEDCRVTPHPLVGPVPGDAPVDLTARIAALRDGPRVPEETFDRRAATCIDEHTGVLGSPSERDFVQVPLHVCELRVADPVGLLGAGSPAPMVTAAAVDFANARRQAALRALATYGSLMLDPRRLALIGGRPVDPGADPDSMLAALKSGRVNGTVWGHGVADGQRYALDASEVFPALRKPSLPYRAPAGIAAGYKWDEALLQALLDQSRRIALARLRAGTAPLVEVELGATVLLDAGKRFRALLAATGEPIRIFDISWSSGIPTAVCYLGSTPAGAASSPSLAGAVAGALGEALLRYQSDTSGQPQFAPPTILGLPALASSHVRPATGHARQVPAPEVAAEPEACALALLARGYRAIAVPLDHDPEVDAVLPYTVHVVVTRA